MRQRFVARTMPMMEGLDVGAIAEGDGWRLTAEPDLEGWDPASRRSIPPDFDEALFAMLTGAHARDMGVED